MPIRAAWNDEHRSGDATVDAQHRALLAHCNRLADLCAGAATDEPAFDAALEQLKTLVREHAPCEQALLADRAGVDLDDLRFEFDEFEHLAGEVATTQHFDRLECQRFLALWCIGHVAGSARLARAAEATAAG